MKKTYMAPAVQRYDVDAAQMLALSLENNGGAQLGGSDFGASGDYEICSERKDPWQHEW